MNSIASARLRDRLGDHLVTIFTNQTISKYIAIDDCESDLQIIEDKALAFPQIKLAFHIWLAMEVTHRYEVLCKFQCLYAGLSLASPGNRKALVFCALFVNEFTDILAETMLWPD